MTAAIDKALHEIGNGIYAYTQLPGSWGWSNAGLIRDGEVSLLVDTLFDLRSTGEMLDEIRGALGGLARFDHLVNTHSNGDHTFGNELVDTPEIIASRACADEMAERKPAHLAKLMREAQGEAVPLRRCDEQFTRCRLDARLVLG